MEQVRLPGGKEVVIRPIHSGDQVALQAAYDRLSPESQYRRFLAPKPHLSVSESRYLAQIDGTDHYALVATALERPDWILAVARFVRLPGEPGVAEMAVVVGDPYQGEGLASALLERLAAAARARGVTRFRATMLANNRPAHQLVRRLASGGARQRRRGHTLEMELDLGSDLRSSVGVVEAHHSHRAAR